jgi:tetratricopeptide (TPR) repeat protein
MLTTDVVRRHFRLISVGLIVPVILVFCGRAVLSSGLSGMGLLAFARHLQASPQATSTPTLLQAEHLLRQAVLRNPANASARRGLGFVLAEQGREEAITAWQATGGMVDELIQRGQQARDVKRYNEALAWYEWAATVEPGLGDPWYYSGLVHEKLEQWEQALKAYEQAVRVGSFGHVGQSSPYYQLGVIYQRRLTSPQFDKALAAYNTAAALDDFGTDLEAAGSYYNRGVIYDRQGRDPRDSIREYRQAVALNPRHKWAYLRLGHALYQAYKDVSLAEWEIERALALWPDDRSRKWPYRFLGNIYRDAGMNENAIVAYEEALRLDANDEQVKKLLAQLVLNHAGADEKKAIPEK